MQYPSYTDYEKANAPWLGDIPSSWETIRLKFTTYIKGRVGWHGLNSKEFLQEGDFYLVTGTDFKKRKIDWDTCYRITEERFEEDPYIHLKNGDLLVTKDGTIGKVAQVEGIPHKASVNSGVFVTRPYDEFPYDTGYMYYVLNSSVFNGFIDIQKSGTTISHLYQKVFEDFIYPYPKDLDEQKEIADFLDYKTQQIDQLIERKKALIEKLNEQRIAVITQAVTKGLDKNAKMKPSGVDWLGDVPAHWGVVKLRFLVSQNLTNGIFKKSVDWGSGYRVINVFDVYVHNDVVNEVSLDRVECNDKEKEKYSAEHGDFFLVRSSLKLEGVGKSASVISPIEEMVFECHLVRGRPDLKKVNPRYLNLFLNSKFAREYFVSRANVVTMATIDQSKFKDLFVSLPRYDEQEDIVNMVDKSLAHIDNMVIASKNVIERLHEYRSSIITDAVTGKIDVRNVEIGEVV